VNTDQAFDLLMDAGVTESISIQTVRRWLREGKIKYDGTGKKKTGYIINDSDQAFDLLKDAGVTKSISIQTVRRWLHEGKIKYDGTRNRKTEYIIDDTASKLFIDDRTDQNKDEIIHQLQLKIKAQDKHIEGIEEIHKTAKNILIQQRDKLDKLNKEIVILKNETSKLQNETKDLLKENIELRNELIKVKENKRDNYNFHSTTQSNDYSKKLGLSKIASNKEVAAEYKGLLKVTHPDHGGNAKFFHYIKTDYDNFRNSIKDK
jgi:predicted site-specific integrase-resolvase